MEVTKKSSKKTRRRRQGSTNRQNHDRLEEIGSENETSQSNTSFGNETVSNKETKNCSDASNTTVTCDEEHEQCTERVEKIDDGDQGNFRQLPVIPLGDEINRHVRLVLQKKPKYGNVDHYLEIQFRQQRERIIGPLRQAVCYYLNGGSDGQDNNLQVYQNVNINEPVYKVSGIHYVISFDVTLLRTVEWETSNRLMPGSLLCLSADNFQTVSVATVTERDPVQVRQGKIVVKLEIKTASQIEIEQSKNSTVYVMVESQRYFMANMCLLKGLQEVNIERMPFRSYFLCGERYLFPPRYVCQNAAYDMSCIAKIQPIQHSKSYLHKAVHQLSNIMTTSWIISRILPWVTSNEDDVASTSKQSEFSKVCILDSRCWPKNEDLGLDDSQAKAMHLALSSSLAIIKGLPGTGKTYLLNKIVKLLYNNQNVWKWSGTTAPILVIFPHTRVLDQFLDEARALTSDLVRISGCHSRESFDTYDIQNLAGCGGSEVTSSEKELAKIRGQIEEQKAILQLLSTHLLHERELQNLPGVDGWLVSELTDGFVEVFGFHPGEWIQSLLAAWLGLTCHNVVSQEDLELFYYHEVHEFKEVDGNTSSTKVDVQSVNKLKPNQVGTSHKSRSETNNDDAKVLCDQSAIGNRCSDTKHASTQQAKDDQQQLSELSLRPSSSPHETSSTNEGPQVDIFTTELDNRQPLFEDNTLVIAPLHFSITRSSWALHIQSLSDPFNDASGNETLTPSQIPLYLIKGNIQRGMAERELLIKKQQLNDTKVKTIKNPWNLPLAHRWCLYRRWLTLFQEQRLREIERLQQSYEAIARYIKELKQQEELAILQNSTIVGSTVAGALMYQDQLKKTGINIVILSEDSEVTESQVVALLPPSTEHLILFGDCCSNEDTTRVTESAHDLFLSDRLIKNGTHHAILEVQHRACPEISKLLSYLNFGSAGTATAAKQVTDVKGLVSNVFFLNHGNDPDAILSLKQAEQEAQFMAGLCVYLTQQGYTAANITVLTTCQEQMRIVRDSVYNKECFSHMRISMVDEYRGEENDIVLVSFASVKELPPLSLPQLTNRLLLALSRARKALYCFGNFDYLSKHNRLWQNLVTILEQDGILGPTLELKCQNHPKTKRRIDLTEDFQTVSPGGGCLEPCSAILSCGHRCQNTCHFGDHLKCSTVSKTFPNCKHTMVLPCQLDVTEAKCVKMMERVLKCGHKVMLMCHIDEECYQCTVKVTRNLPACQHQNEMECHVNMINFKCERKCMFRLDCGHQCPRLCHVIQNPSHDEVVCTKPCQRKVCERGHKCIMRCCEPCIVGKCNVSVEKVLACGHSGHVPCHQEPREITNVICRENCQRVMACGHQCQRTCSDLCGGCVAVVLKRIPKCGHTILVNCVSNPALVVCNQKCNRLLPCRHACTNSCSAPCIQQCKQLVNVTLFCGHSVEVECHSRLQFEKSKPLCEVPCNSLLPCEHWCKGTCGKCRQGRVHVSCNEKCNRILICGHPCETSCSQTCVPCRRSCENRCVHSYCPEKCGQPCKRCLEPCPWRCPHFACKNCCGENCTRPGCDEPCTQNLPCGHPCVGLCGEPCPSLCRICNFADLTEFILSGSECDDNARFVKIEECGHCIEVSAMDRWMATDDKEIYMKGCPRCKTTIWYNPRYNNIIRTRMLDVQSVKKRMFGSKKILKGSKIQLKDIMKVKCITDEVFKDEILQLQLHLNRPALFHQYELAVLENQINMLDLMIKMKKKTRNMTEEAKEYFVIDIKSLAQRLMKNEERITEYELNQINSEVHRVFLTTAVMHTENQLSGRSNARCAAHLKKAKQIMKKSGVLTTNEQKQVADALEEAMQLRGGLGISDAERVTIVAAMGFEPGHWFKCPNDHIYVISECGGAMQRGTCNVCGEEIGGEQHTLMSTNALAGEMDGSMYPAWSNEANLRRDL